MKKISIISPCYNESELIEDFFYELNKQIKTLKNYQFEIIIINDGSTDNSLEILSKKAEENDNILIIDLNRNFGKEVAVTAGIDNCNSDAAIIIDFDLQDPPQLIQDFVEKWQEGYEMVVGVRSDRSSDNFLKRYTAEFFYIIYNKLSNSKIKFNAADFRLIDRKIINDIKKIQERERFMRGIFSWIGAKTYYAKYSRPKRLKGDSKFSGIKLWNHALNGITSFSTAPLKIWTYVGFTISLFSFVYILFIIYHKLTNDYVTAGYSSLIASILFLGGVQIMGIGILGEYLGRVYIESKQRPLYLIRNIIKKSKK